MLSVYVGGKSFWDVKAIGTVRASCNVIAVSALWLIKCALARAPPPSILYGGMIITGDVLLRTLVDRRVFVVVGLGSSCINAGSALVIFGRGLLMVYACRCDQIELCSWVRHLHDCRGIRYPRYHLDVCIFTRGALYNVVGGHPLFLLIWGR